MNQQTWTKVGNVLGYLIIQSTFGIIYFTFDVCKKVEKVEEQGHPNNNLTCTKDQTAYIYENNNSDKFSSSLEGFHLSLHPLSTLDISMCAKLQNSSTQKFENSVLFSKLEDVEWVRTCMISAMGVVAFLVSIVLNADCLQPHQRAYFSRRRSGIKLFSMPFLPPSSITSHKILLFIGCAFVLCGPFVSAITVKTSLPLFILT